VLAQRNGFAAQRTGEAMDPLAGMIAGQRFGNGASGEVLPGVAEDGGWIAEELLENSLKADSPRACRRLFKQKISEISVFRHGRADSAW
jgi:AMMECR1 domain-containing protein